MVNDLQTEFKIARVICFCKIQLNKAVHIRSVVGKLWLAASFCTACKLRMFFIFFVG